MSNEENEGGFISHLTELRKRLIQRNQDKPHVVSERLNAYERDSAHKKDYDFVVINDNLEDCFREVEKIVISKKGKI